MQQNDIMVKEKSMLNIEHLSKNYGDKKAIDDLTLHISPGEIYVLSVITVQVRQRP